MRLLSIANSRRLQSTVQRWRRVESGVIGQTAVRWRLVVKFGFGGGLCAPEQGDGNLIHYRREREHTNRPRPHHRSVQFLGSQAEAVHRAPVNLIDTATDSLRL